MRIDLLEKILLTGKKDQKRALIAQFDEPTQFLVGCALDPAITFGVTVPDDGKGIEIVGDFYGDILFTNKLRDTLVRLSCRDVTGNAANDEVMMTLVRSPSNEHLKWACRIINRELRAGFDRSTFNKVFGGEESIKKFEVQLADVYDPEDELGGTYYVEPKLDGNRVVLLDEKAWSRSGKQYQQCNQHIDGLLKVCPDFFEKYVLDGEMMGNLGFDKSSGALRRLDKDQTATFTYWVFDVVKREQWESQRTDTCDMRKKLLHGEIKEILAKIPNEPIKIVQHETLTNPTHQQVMFAVKNYVELGFEGAMLKSANSPYVFKRGENVLKAKLFKDIDCPIVGIYEGKGRHKGRLGGIVITHNGYETKVGSGWTDELRNEVWNNQADWLSGAVAQVQYQDVGPKGGLRFPVFIMRRRDKES